MPPIFDSEVNLDNMRIKEVSNIDPVTVNTPNVADMGLRLTQLPDIRLAITEIPKITIETDSTLNVHIKEIPDIRAHLPANFTVGFSLLGIELFTIDLCGEAQMITEKYFPRKPEKC